MGINRPGMNPNQFYWEKKDTKIGTEQIKNHSGLTDDPFSNFCEFYNFAVEKIKTHVENMKLPTRGEIETEVSSFINEALSESLNHMPNLQDRLRRRQNAGARRTPATILSVPRDLRRSAVF